MVVALHSLCNNPLGAVYETVHFSLPQALWHKLGATFNAKCLLKDNAPPRVDRHNDFLGLVTSSGDHLMKTASWQIL